MYSTNEQKYNLSVNWINIKTSVTGTISSVTLTFCMPSSIKIPDEGNPKQNLTLFKDNFHLIWTEGGAITVDKRK